MLPSPFNIFTSVIESCGKGSVQSDEDSFLRHYKTIRNKPYVPLEYGKDKGMIPDNSALVSSEKQFRDLSHLRANVH